MSNANKSLQLNSQETSTVLAALRFYELNNQGDPNYRTDAIHDIAVTNDDETSMDDHDIAILFEKIKSTLVC